MADLFKSSILAPPLCEWQWLRGANMY